MSDTFPDARRQAEQRLTRFPVVTGAVRQSREVLAGGRRALALESERRGWRIEGPMRAFLAIQLPASVQAALDELQGQLRGSGADVKWAAAHTLHVTLKFLDEISEGERRAVEELAGAIASEQESFLLGLGGVGAFPSLGSPRVIWVGVEQGREAVERIARQIEERGRTIPLRSEERPFSAHVTLGRLRSPRGLSELSQRLQAARWQPPAPWRVEALTLYHSMLGPRGPSYAALATVPFRVPGGGDEANRGRSGRPAA